MNEMSKTIFEEVKNINNSYKAKKEAREELNQKPDEIENAIYKLSQAVMDIYSQALLD